MNIDEIYKKNAHNHTDYGHLLLLFGVNHCARRGTRTPMPKPALAPETSVSTNSTIRANFSQQI